MSKCIFQAVTCSHNWILCILLYFKCFSHIFQFHIMQNFFSKTIHYIRSKIIWDYTPCINKV